LYGVTVGDDSVSRVISLRLDEATALAGRSNGSRAGSARDGDGEADQTSIPVGTATVE
jgi:hypothetical protein